MKLGVYFIGIFLSLLALFSAVPPSSKADETATPLRVGIFPFEPINFVDETGQAQGLYPDLLRAIAKEEHWQLEFVPGNWGEGLDRLQSGTIDLMESVAYSNKRAEIMDFTHESLMELWGQVFIHPEGSIHNISDLAGRRVAIMHDDISGANFLATARKFNVQCEILEFPTHGDVFTAVKEGAVNAGVAPQHFGLRHAKAYDLVPSTIQFSPFSIYFATKKGMHFDVLTKIDRQLILWKQDKESYYYQRLNHWLGIQTHSSPVIPRWLLWTLAAIAISVIVLLIMSMIMKSQVKKRTSELQASEEYNRMLFDQSPIGLAVARMDGTLVDVNPAYARIIGRTIDDTLNLTYWNITPDKYALQEQQQLTLLTSEGRYGPYEKEYIHKDGHLVPVRQNGLLIELKGEKHLWSSVEDITERKRAEREQSLMHDRFVSIMNSLDALVYVADMESYKILFINEYGRKLFGNIEGKICWQALQSGQSEPCSFCTNHRLVKNGEATGVYVWEFQNTVNGDWFQCRDKAILWHDKRLVRMEIATDITEQMLAAKELEKQKTTFESLFESIPDAILLTDIERRIVAINKGFTDIFGYTLDEVVGKPTSVIYANEEQFFRQGSQRYNLSAEDAAKPYVTSYMRKNGILLSGETIGTKALTPSGEVLGFFGLIRDVSEKLKQEEAHRQAQKMEAIGTLSGGISHDFNNLLAIISGNIDIIQHKQQAGTSSEENIGHIKETVSRAKNLVSQILAFSRQEKHALSPVDFSIVVADSLKLLRSTIPVTVEILVEVESDPIFINADTTQIQQVLINLCTNAVHAMDEKGVLRASLGKVESGSQHLPEALGQQPGGYAKLSVSDSGCGIEKEHIERIFDPFFTTKDVGMGTGMGLSAAYGIVEQHGGVITVDSTPGQGTTFDIYLPVITAQKQEPKTDTEDSLPTGTERILFVDDEECIAESCCELLEYQGYTVTSVTSGSEALELFKKSPEDFDLVFTDQTMPRMTGVELAEELLKISPDIPIILCSGYAAKVSEDIAKGIGIREFCMKPIDIKQLATVARKVLDEKNPSS